MTGARAACKTVGGVMAIVLAHPCLGQGLLGTELEGSVSHGPPITFTHIYGTLQSVINPFFDGTSFLLDSPAPDAFMAGFENAIAIDFSNFAYSDYPGQTGTLSLSSLDIDVGPGSIRVFNGAGIEIGSGDGSGSSLTAMWPVDAVPGDGPNPRVVVGWNSIPAPGVLALSGLGCAAILRRRRII